MQNTAFFITLLLGCLLVSLTAYFIYIGFGPPSLQLRDPFEEHED
uniref:Protein PsbN n=1 Tax=Codium arenicola TaxID=1191365 RepID=A0A2P0QI50_9CHLO|nr:photosystem II protein N [Codium arenicola]ARO74402.1 photosystem II protein N [Codium arenicola]